MKFDKSLAARLEAADAAGSLEHAQTRARLEPESNCRWAEVGEGVAVYSGHASPVRGVATAVMTASAGRGLYLPLPASSRRTLLWRPRSRKRPRPPEFAGSEAEAGRAEKEEQSVRIRNPAAVSNASYRHGCSVSGRAMPLRAVE